MTAPSPAETPTEARAGKPRRKAGRLRTAVSILVMLLGVVVLFYPFVAQKINSRQEVRVVATYDKAQADLKKSQRSKLLSDAAGYNKKIRTGQTPVAGLGEDLYKSDSLYLNQLDVSGVMGAVEIPKISVNLPIRHGTTSEALGNGVGHLYGTTLPIGGKGTNAVLAGHRGLPNAEIFTRLNELEKGDTFYIKVAGKKLAYQVDAIWTVDPSDVSHFGIDPDKDYVTLLTCTPYGINTQRLLVRGHRVPLKSVQQQQDHGLYPDVYIVGLGVAVVLVFAITAVICVRKRRKRVS
ncbi:class C sortase [Bifidobacterium moukalabense]|uniref:class C sortase n=1 Tax=Bifidobacterium moukalabense TaxID=1333651 RepID=UPI0010F63A8B|nr:class C sortase [Bifidobacterium moukalabense]